VIATIVVIAAAVVALIYVALPLVRNSGPELADDRDEPLARKRAALEGIVDLEDERAAGKLTDEDFAALVGGYERAAIDAMHHLDALRGTEPVGVEEVGGDEVEAEIAAARRRLACPACGHLRPSGAPCPRCGR
jgi:hypothetical protein